MSNKEYEVFKNNYLQHPITSLTEENLDKLETHCRKAIHYERGVEHQVVLELLERHKEHLSEREQDKKRIKELEEQVKILDEAYTGAIKESKKWFDIAHSSIPKQKLKDKIEDYTERKRYYDDNNIFKDEEYYKILGTIEVLEELLEEK